MPRHHQSSVTDLYDLPRSPSLPFPSLPLSSPPLPSAPLPPHSLRTCGLPRLRFKASVSLLPSCPPDRELMNTMSGHSGMSLSTSYVSMVYATGTLQRRCPCQTATAMAPCSHAHGVTSCPQELHQHAHWYGRRSASCSSATLLYASGSEGLADTCVNILVRQTFRTSQARRADGDLPRWVSSQREHGSRAPFLWSPLFAGS